jgi:FPC/CPF motif-containing protein YcgG
MACPKDDQSILQFLYEFVDEYRQSDELFHSAAVIFKEPLIRSEDEYEELIWKRLQAFADLDAKNHTYDKRVDSDPASPHFSFSLKEEAFFIVGLNPSGSRLARQFKYPALVFNPHAQFERLRETNLFEHMKKVIRKRDTDYSGSFNPMLEDFGKSSEVYQYSGRQYDERWQCPFKPNHGSDEYNTTT